MHKGPISLRRPLVVIALMAAAALPLSVSGADRVVLDAYFNATW